VPVPRQYRTTAVVLSRFDLGEADRVLTLLAPEEGRFKAIAKGIRRPRSRLGGSLEPFAELDVVLSRGRTFDIVTQVAVRHAWLGIRDHLETTATAWYLSELVARSTEERAPAVRLYALLVHAFALLDGGVNPARLARWYEFHLLDELGLQPEVDRCVECDRLLEPGERYGWVPALGGVLCDRHEGPPAERSTVSLEALKLLKAYRHRDIAEIASLRLPAAVESEVERALRMFVRHALEREARSLAFLDEVRSGE
jgi:DNA repair protein RecO (recombination protein O)